MLGAVCSNRPAHGVYREYTIYAHDHVPSNSSEALIR